VTDPNEKPRRVATAGPISLTVIAFPGCTVQATYLRSAESQAENFLGQISRGERERCETSRRAAKRRNCNTLHASLSAGSHDVLDWNHVTRHAVRRRDPDSSRTTSSTILENTRPRNAKPRLRAGLLRTGRGREKLMT